MSVIWDRLIDCKDEIIDIFNEKATEYEATLGLDVQEEIGKEEARIEDEAKAAAKAAKKKKKKK